MQENMEITPSIKNKQDSGRTGVSKDVINKKVIELLNLRDKIKPEQFRQRLDILQNAIHSDNRGTVEGRIYDKWTPENIQEVLDGLDSEEFKFDDEPSKPSQVKEALGEAMYNKDINKVGPPSWIEEQMKLLKDKSDQFLEAFRKLKGK